MLISSPRRCASVVAFSVLLFATSVQAAHFTSKAAGNWSASSTWWAAPPSKTNLIASWELDEASGSATDAHTNGLTLTDNNSVTSDNGKVHTLARLFTAANSEYLSRASESLLQMGDIDFTIEAWVYRVGTSGTQSIVAKDSASGRDYTLDAVGGSYRFYINGGGSGTTQVTVGGAGTTGAWQHIIAQHSATNNTLRIRLNNGTAVTTSTGGTAPVTSSTQFCIGRRQYSGNEDYWDGRIQCVRIWKRNLTPAEEDGLWNVGDGLVYSDLGTAGNTTTPGDGDTATIDGHAVVLDADATIGRSPADDDADFDLTVQGGGTLTVSTGSKLTLRGRALQTGNNSDVTFEAGSELEFDASLADNPTDQNYPWLIGVGSEIGLDAPQININVGSGSRVHVSSNAAGGNGYFATTAANDGGRVIARVTTFTRIGTASIPATASKAGFATGLDVSGCDWIDCGSVSPGVGSDIEFSYTDNFHRGTLGSTCLAVGISTGTPAPTGARVISGCSFDKSAVIPVPDLECDDNIFLGGFAYSQGVGRAEFINTCLWRAAFTDSGNRNGDMDECLIINDSSTLDVSDGTYSATATTSNPHWTSPGPISGTYVVRDSVVEDFGSTDDGDVDYGPNNTGLNSEFYNVIGLSQTGDNSGTLATFNGWSGAACKYEHCTWKSAQAGPMAVGESSFGYEGMLASYRSNLFWRSSYSATIFKVGSYNTGSLVDDIGFAADLDYNAVWNLNSTTGVGGNGYNLPLTGTPGVHDVTLSGDPFVDSAANFSTWVASLEPTWSGNASPSRTDYNARGLWKIYLSKRPSDPDYDSRYTLAAYLTYIRNAFRPIDESLRGAAHDAGDIGAVAMAAPATGQSNPINNGRTNNGRINRGMVR